MFENAFQGSSIFVYFVSLVVISSVDHRWRPVRHRSREIHQRHHGERELWYSFSGCHSQNRPTGENFNQLVLRRVFMVANILT